MITTAAPQKAEVPASKPKRLRDQYREWLVFHHYSPRTVATYIGWVLKFVIWSGKRDPRTMGGSKVTAFLSYLANSCHVTVTTQRQALCALVRFYDGCLGQPLGELEEFAYASKPHRLPVVMSKNEVQQVIAALTGTFRIMAKLMYGCGLRLMECCRLRVKDIDWERGVINVRGGKGDKDRNVPLPDSVRAELQAHLVQNRIRFDHDGGWPVHLPDGLLRKYPGYERDWNWQYVFAARSLSPDPADGRLKMHHVHENGLQKAVHGAVRLCGFTKRITCHTFRHSFATHLLEANVPIYDVKDLLGHSRLETTMIYNHVASPVERRIRSPLDA